MGPLWEITLLLLYWSFMEINIIRDGGVPISCHWLPEPAAGNWWVMTTSWSTVKMVVKWLQSNIHELDAIRGCLMVSLLWGIMTNVRQERYLGLLGWVSLAKILNSLEHSELDIRPPLWRISYAYVCVYNLVKAIVLWIRFCFRDCIQLFASKYVCHFCSPLVNEPSKHCYLFVNDLGRPRWNITVKILVPGMGEIS